MPEFFLPSERARAFLITLHEADRITHNVFQLISDDFPAASLTSPKYRSLSSTGDGPKKKGLVVTGKNAADGEQEKNRGKLLVENSITAAGVVPYLTL